MPRKCPEEKRAYQRKWAAEHRELVREYQRRYLERIGADAAAEYAHYYYLAHREALLQRRYRHQRAHAAERQAYERKRHESPEFRAYRREYMRRRKAAIKAGVWPSRLLAVSRQYSVSCLGHCMTISASHANTARSEAAKIWGVPFKTVKAVRIFSKH